MATTGLETVLRNVRRCLLRHDIAGQTDGTLLESFITQRDEAAFEALVHRHGPMVLGVCRRVLRNEAAAEDAFQATFLVLVRKASSIRPRGMVGNWLYGVAQNTARKAKAMNIRIRDREREAGARPKPEAASENWQLLQVLLDQELQALPDKYRAPIVLCDLEGKSIKEAARHLDCPPGTIGTRLARGRKLLARRLARHGLTSSAGLIAAVLSQNAASAIVPVPLLTSTINAASCFAAGKAASGVVGANVAALTEGVLKAMLLTKLKIATATLLGIALLGAGMAGLKNLALASEPANVEQTEPGKDKKAKQPAPQPEPKGQAAKKVAKSDKEKIQGTWEVLSIEQDGTKFPEGNAGKEERLAVFAGDKFARKAEHGQTAKGLVFKLDATKKPKSIDLTASDGKTMLGLYELDGDDLKICVSTADEPKRPTEIASSFGSSTMLWILKRREPAKVEKKEPAKDKKADQPAPQADAKDQAAREVARVLNAHGGEANLRKLKSFTLRVQTSSLVTSQKIDGQFFIENPERARWEFKVDDDLNGSVKIIQVKDRDKNWRNVDDRETVNHVENKFAEEVLEFLGPRAPLRLKDPAMKVAWIGERVATAPDLLGDRAAICIELARKDGKVFAPSYAPTGGTKEVRLFFDKESGLLFKQEFDCDGQQIELFYTEYKVLHGIPLAQRIVQRTDGQLNYRSEVEFNIVDKLDAKLFQKP